MDDYRGKMCVIDGKYLARCVGQDFILRVLTFEVEPDGLQFEKHGDYGVVVREEGPLSLNDVRHLLSKVE